ncbi:hypothetical protein FVEN_g12939 [Fusarium venenatum]|nr:hypothetical protein FVEN_g12939 [Fusarium venenatum]
MAPLAEREIFSAEWMTAWQRWENPGEMNPAIEHKEQTLDNHNPLLLEIYVMLKK